MEPAAVFGHNVRRERERRGWSQEELGHRADLHPTNVSGVEAGRRQPRFDTVLRLARALEVSPSRLFDGIR
ncbi:helix-turn-helix transcriptional regulator [Thermoleophilia bacterium SCSIO 60948]|nr:helix-turn-helix transcriptional regulator [Thermoleophilia bacterium SCSIO 60948]